MSELKSLYKNTTIGLATICLVSIALAIAMWSAGAFWQFMLSPIFASIYVGKDYYQRFKTTP